MNKITLLIFLLSAAVHSQIINFPDPAFKSYLLSSSPENPVILDAGYSGISLDSNADGEIDMQEALLAYSMVVQGQVANMEGVRNCTNLRAINCSGTGMATLDVSGLTNLTTLLCDGNLLTSLTLQNCPSLQTLWCEYNNLTSLDVSGAPDLREFTCRNNLLTSFTLGSQPMLTDLNCGANFYTSLDVSQCPSLLHFACSSIPITSLDVSNCTSLTMLDIENTNIPEIDLSMLSSLQSFHCGWAHLTTLDISNNHSLTSLTCSIMPDLQSIFMKNGLFSTQTQYSISDTPALEFVCTNDEDVLFYINYLASQGMTQVNVNSYCTFTPGGTYNTISGHIAYDYSGDGCDAGDSPAHFQRVDLSDGTNSYSAFTSADGSYTFYTPAGSFTVTPHLENTLWYNISPASANVSFPSANGSSSAQDFCIAPNGTHPDLEITIVPQAPFRPGFDSAVKIIYHNKGTVPISDLINFTFDDTVLDLVASSPVQSGSASGSLDYNFVNLMPFETREIYVTFHLNSPTDTPAVDSGYVLYFGAVINPVATDESPRDNSFTLVQTVVNSFDPNAKQCLEGASVSDTEIGKYLHYNIEFENLGTAAAENVVVEDMIDTSKFDVSSLEVLYSSHPANVKITGNKVEVIFEGINLPATENNHGNVVFKIKTLDTLSAGDQVANTANIYFDYNLPVATNEARTTFAQLSAQQFAIGKSISAYPNPANDEINISANDKITSVCLFDTQGRLLETIMPGKDTLSIDISARQSGIYFVKASTSKSTSVIKIVKD